MAKKRKASSRGKKARVRRKAGTYPVSAFASMTIEQLKTAPSPDWTHSQKTAWQIEMMQREDPLPHTLHSYIDSTIPGIPYLKHPLFAGPIDTQRAALATWMIAYREQLIAAAVAEKNWYKVVFLHEKLFLHDAFREYEASFDDQSYWMILGKIWTQQEQLWPNRKWFLQVFNSPRPERDHLMSPEEHDVFGALPDMFQIYRGFIGKRGEGLSWSLDRAKAEWFARRFSILTELGEPRLMLGVVSKKDVLAYFDERAEKEIVVDPANVRSMKVESVTPSENDESDEDD
jgi:hypothetical protein